MITSTNKYLHTRKSDKKERKNQDDNWDEALSK